MATTGAAVALNYGFNWITGEKLQGITLENTGSPALDYTRIGMWLLGEGEMDGLVEMWDTQLGRLMWESELADPARLHWHQGCDSVIGSGMAPISTGRDQGVDSFWSNLPAGLQPLHYNRWAYYAIKLKWNIDNAPNTNDDDPSVWADVNPIGLWRGIRCRIFDSNGAMAGYAFTRNPAWHYVDLICRRKLFPEYLIDSALGAQDLPTAVRNRFDWAAIADSAESFDQLGRNGQPLFAGDYSFSQKTSLQACVTQIATNSRSYQRERSGTYALIADKPRSSVFTFSRENADSFSVTDEDLHTAPNFYVANFRDLQVPAIATIASIRNDGGTLTVFTEAAHCAVAQDYVVLGNTGTRFDGNWTVLGVADALSMVLQSKGSNYPTSVGSGGLVGLRYSRFKARSPQFQHKAYQLARGAVGVGIPRQRNKVSVETDFANCTWDQVSRVSEYQLGIALGPDVQPYVGPTKATLQAPLFAPDAAGSGAVVIEIEPGDVVTIDDTLSTAYAGDYEVMPTNLTLTGSTPGDGTQRTPVAGGAQLTLRPYNVANYPAEATTSEPGWPDVPGLPGGDPGGTVIPLADGQMIFFTGSGETRSSFPMPLGYSTNHLLCWASPQGFIEDDAQLHFIQDCDVYTTREMQLIYSDSSKFWNGDLNYCGLAWSSNRSVSVFNLKEMTYVELTLQGGEKIIFGKGYMPSNTQAPLPDGYVDQQTIALAFPKNGPETGNSAHGFLGTVNADGRVHHSYQDGEGHTWEGNAQVMIVSYKNNMGTWFKDPSGWAHCLLPEGKTFAIGGFSLYSSAPPDVYGISSGLTQVSGSGAPTHIPAMAGMSSATIQVMPGPDGFDIVDHPCHGVKQCTVDGDLIATCLFEDGEGNIWGGATCAFSLLCDVATGATGTNPPPSGGITWPGTGSESDGTIASIHGPGLGGVGGPLPVA